MAGNRNTRLEKVSQNLKPAKPIKVFYFDYEGTNLYTKPFSEPGAELVTPAQLEQARKANTVLLVKYEEQKPVNVS